MVLAGITSVIVKNVRYPSLLTVLCSPFSFAFHYLVVVSEKAFPMSSGKPVLFVRGLLYLYSLKRYICGFGETFGFNLHSRIVLIVFTSNL